jgi:hypothetical protein
LHLHFKIIIYRTNEITVAKRYDHATKDIPSLCKVVLPKNCWHTARHPFVKKHITASKNHFCFVFTVFLFTLRLKEKRIIIIPAILKIPNCSLKQTAETIIGIIMPEFTISTVSERFPQDMA